MEQYLINNPQTMSALFGDSHDLELPKRTLNFKGYAAVVSYVMITSLNVSLLGS